MKCCCFHRDAALSRVYSSAMFFEKILWSFQGFISVPCQSSGRCGIPSGRSSVSNIRPDAHQCLKASNSSRLHPSDHNRKSSGRSSEFEKIPVFHRIRPDAIQCLTRNRVSASRHSYGKTAATVLTMCDPVRTMSSIRQECAYQVQPSGRQPSWSERSSFIYENCVHQFNHPDVSLQGPDVPSYIMVISCSRSATFRTLGQHRPDAAMLWKLSALS
jgi:hypothetical protein